MFESIATGLMFVGVAVTWVMSTATLAVVGVGLYLFIDYTQRPDEWEGRT